MASRPFATVLLEMFRPPRFESKNSGIDVQNDNGGQSSDKMGLVAGDSALVEPTPVSFEPCFGSNVGVMSLFVQLPGRPNLAIGSALVSLDDDPTGPANNGDTPEESCDQQVGKRQASNKEQVSVKNV